MLIHPALVFFKGVEPSRTISKLLCCIISWVILYALFYWPVGWKTRWFCCGQLERQTPVPNIIYGHTAVSHKLSHSSAKHYNIQQRSGMTVFWHWSYTCNLCENRIMLHDVFGFCVTCATFQNIFDCNLTWRVFYCINQRQTIMITITVAFVPLVDCFHQTALLLHLSSS